MKNNKKTVFLTGATGLVGSYLLKILLQEGYKVYVLARSKDNKNARDRVIDVLKFWDKDILSQTRMSQRDSKDNENNPPSPPFSKGGQGGFVVLEGDITKKNLGLNKQSIDLLKNEVEEIFHCAAVTHFKWPLKDIRQANVEGTKNVLELAVECNKNSPPTPPFNKGGQGGFSEQKGKFKKVNHISTAYVCGDYKGIFKEDDLDVGQGFSTTYEQSKFEAEKLVEKYRKKGLWIDIFRPPLVLGESVTGKTITFQQSVYQLLHMWNLEIFDHFPCKGVSINLVFVDDLCKAIFKISAQTSPLFNSPLTKGGLSGETYHPFHTEAVPLEAILDISSKFLGFKKPELVSRKDFLKKILTPAQKILLQNNILLFNDYVKLNSIMTNNALKKYRFEFSDFNRDSFLNLLKYCIKEGFLKKRDYAINSQRS